MKFVRINAGTFTMGHKGELPDHIKSAKEFSGGRDVWLPSNGDYDEGPKHKVTITKPFYIGVTEVTNEQYEQFDRLHIHLRGKKAFSIDGDEAVVFISWHEAKAFCDWLSKKEGLPYRLPTEAEWEYVCRAEKTTHYSTGDTLPQVFIKNPDNSWYPNPVRGRGSKEVVPLHVGKTPPNPWGLYDMHGNVEEWCHDWYGPYDKSHQIDPVGRVDGDFKVTRGGSHGTFPYYLRSANRLGTVPEDKSWFIGFRIVLGRMPRTKRLPMPPPHMQVPTSRSLISKDLAISSKSRWIPTARSITGIIIVPLSSNVLTVTSWPSGTPRLPSGDAKWPSPQAGFVGPKTNGSRPRSSGTLPTVTAVLWLCGPTTKTQSIISTRFRLLRRGARWLSLCELPSTAVSRGRRPGSSCLNMIHVTRLWNPYFKPKRDISYCPVMRLRAAEAAPLYTLAATAAEPGPMQAAPLPVSTGRLLNSRTAV
jgi:formylglycine-generating enzyme required for sulfatase activity